MSRQVAKKMIVAKSENGAPTGPPEAPEDELFLPVLWCSRDPKTPEEAAEFRRWNVVWAELFAGGILEEVVKDHKHAARSTKAAVYALIRYAEDKGLEGVFAKTILGHAELQGWPDAKRINDRSFEDLLTTAQQAARDSRQNK
jgi:hypothetical protein